MCGVRQHDIVCLFVVENLDRCKGPGKAPAEDVRRPTRGKVTEKVIFGPECIFCGVAGYKKVRVKGVRTSENTIYFERDGGQIVFDAANDYHDETLLTRIRGFDLFACEAKYHPSCKSSYNKTYYYKSGTSEDVKKQQDKCIAAHNVAYECVVQFINEHIVNGREVHKLAYLRELYVNSLSNTDFANPNYRSANLRNKLTVDKRINDLIGFECITVGKTFPLYIVFSTSIGLGEAIGKAYKLAHQDMHKKVAMELANSIKCLHNNTPKMKWPPDQEDLKVDKAEIPEDLLRFLTLLISGKDMNYSQRIERVAFSIRCDLCRAATNGQGKLTKHILTLVVLRHLYRGKEVGHNENSLPNIYFLSRYS